MKAVRSTRVKIGLIFILVCIFFHSVGESGALALSIEEERQMGQQFLIQITSVFPLVDDDFANTYINELGQYLLKSLEMKPFNFHFYIIQSDDLNAFAGPGGHIFFFTGLIDVMDEVDELAAVIAHEIGHVSARHLSERIEQNTKLQFATLAAILAGALIGGKAQSAIVTGSMAAAMQKQLAYSRDDERQADQLGFKYMSEAGFSPGSMIKTLKKIQSEQMLAVNQIPAYLLTHPGGPERTANYETMMIGDKSLIHESADTVKYRQFFPIFKAILRAKYSDPKDAERAFNRDLENDPKSIWAHFGLGIVLRETQQYAKATENFHEALKGRPHSIFIIRNLAETYQLMGRADEAIPLLSEALKWDPNDRTSLYLMAVSYENLEEYEKAIPIFEKLTSMKPVKNEVYYNIGICYGRLNKLALAHYNFGIFFKREGKPGKAQFHFQKAEEFSQNDPALRERIMKAKQGPS
jgi:predicted Zn-dependent protease